MAVSIFCPFCQRHTALLAAQAEYSFGFNDTRRTPAAWEKNGMETWWIGVCNNCNSPVLVLNNGELIYPTPLPSPTDSRIPNPMHQDLAEAKRCYSVEAYRACAVIARRAMQNACIEKGANKQKLVDQINELKANGTITKDLKEWADVVRWVGNDAAHPNNDDVD